MADHQLNQLADLKSRGVLSDAEYDALKSKIVAHDVSEPAGHQPIYPTEERLGEDYEAQLAALPVSEPWRTIFRCFLKQENEGLEPSSGDPDDSPNSRLTARLKRGFNIWGFLLGPLYFFHLGLTEKGLALIGFTLSYFALLRLLALRAGPLPLLLYFLVPALACAVRVNRDYYEKLIQGKGMWPVMPLFASKRASLGFSAAALFVLLLIPPAGDFAEWRATRSGSGGASKSTVHALAKGQGRGPEDPNWFGYAHPGEKFKTPEPQGADLVGQVKTGYLEGYSQTTIGDAFSQYPYYKSISWENVAATLRDSSAGPKVTIKANFDMGKAIKQDFSRYPISSGDMAEVSSALREVFNEVGVSLNAEHTFTFELKNDGQFKLVSASKITSMPDGSKRTDAVSSSWGDKASEAIYQRQPVPDYKNFLEQAEEFNRTGQIPR